MDPLNSSVGEEEEIFQPPSKKHLVEIEDGVYEPKPSDFKEKGAATSDSSGSEDNDDNGYDCFNPSPSNSPDSCGFRSDDTFSDPETERQCRAYARELRDTQGYDVKEYPRVETGNMLPVDLSKKDDWLASEAENVFQWTINQINEDRKTPEPLVEAELEKVMYAFAFNTYAFTFSARMVNQSSEDAKAYQAKVQIRFNGHEHVIREFRVKPAKTPNVKPAETPKL